MAPFAKDVRCKASGWYKPKMKEKEHREEDEQRETGKRMNKERKMNREKMKDAL
jgi:hypothetical protein